MRQRRDARVMNTAKKVEEHKRQARRAIKDAHMRIDGDCACMISISDFVLCCVGGYYGFRDVR